MKQVIGQGVTTEIIGRPGEYVFQESSSASWIEVDGATLRLGPLGIGVGVWTLTSSPDEPAPDAP